MAQSVCARVCVRVCSFVCACVQAECVCPCTGEALCLCACMSECMCACELTHCGISALLVVGPSVLVCECAFF